MAIITTQKLYFKPLDYHLENHINQLLFLGGGHFSEAAFRAAVDCSLHFVTFLKFFGDFQQKIYVPRR